MLPGVLSLNGKLLYPKSPSDALLEKLSQHSQNFEKDSTNEDHIIWYGRFLAYAGQYERAIEVFSRGIELFPSDARFLRHRGHRYITMRKFDQAIADLEKAAIMIKDEPNQVEPDGMPNAQNIPVSTLQGNIYYHLGLAYYLKQDFDKALQAYIDCLRSTQNDDNVVSATHWIYTIMCRQIPPGDPTEFLMAISPSMQVIENMSYHRLCLLYNGKLKEDEVTAGMPVGPALDAVNYGIARWHNCRGDVEKANLMLEEILTHPDWASFGYIAAEADLFNNN
jgi:tetratricopeptide (TPR) repeat protein